MESLLSTNETTRERWRRALDLVEHTSEMPALERTAWLAQACGTDFQLSTTVRELLAATTVAETENFMEQPLWSYAPPADDPERLIGQQFGAWRLTRFISAGGMGRVYLAERTDDLFNRQAAIKVIGKNLSEQAYQRFYREVRILGALQHPNLVFLYDAGRMADGQPYLLMEYLPGPDLRAWLTGRGALPVEQVLELTRQISAGLHAAHQAGVIHRDLKPANLIVTETAGGALSIKLLDFGLAYRQQPQAFDTALTETGTLLGTLAYMAPEQIRGVSHDQLTPAADLYALGLIVYEMLTGRRAFLGTTREDFIADHLREMPTLPSTARPDLGIPKAVDQVVLKMLAKEPGERYQAAPAFFQDLTVALHKPAPLHAPLLPRPRPPVRSALKWLALALLVLPPAALGAYFGWRDKTPITLRQTPQQDVPPAAAQSGNLRINLGIRRPTGLVFSGCRFALLNAAVLAASTTSDSADTLVLLEEIGSDGRSKIVKETRMSAGNYAMRFECPGFQTVSGPVTLAENPARPGWATVAFDLKPK
jgi:serine/threonine protein kinase